MQKCKLAICVYGQPRMISETFKWRATYWKDVARQCSVDLEIDWFYHLWDGVNGNQLFVDDTDITDYQVAKKKSADNMHWISCIHRIHPKETRNLIKDLHSQYEFNAPIFPRNDIDTAYEQLDKFYKEYCRPIFKQYCIDLHSNRTDESYWLLRYFELYCNHHLVQDFSAFVSAAKSIELLKNQTDNSYDHVVLCRTDGIIKPSESKVMANFLSSGNKWNENFWDNGHALAERVEVARVFAGNDLVIWYHDFFSMASAETFYFMWDHWEKKLSSILFKNATSEDLSKRYNLPITSGHGIHSIPAVMAAPKLYDGRSISFGDFNKLFTFQTLLRKGLDYDNLDCTDENYEKVSYHFFETQTRIRPNV